MEGITAAVRIAALQSPPFHFIRRITGAAHASPCLPTVEQQALKGGMGCPVKWAAFERFGPLLSGFSAL